ncbi:MAG: type II toxin-antitoxin system prevent-host-death family antitoxin [bacterium]
MAVSLKRGNLARDLDIPETISAATARQMFYTLLKNVEYSNRSYILTRAGKPVARIVNLNEWKEIMTTLEIMVEPEHQAELDKAIREVKEGKIHSFEEVFGHKQSNL